MAETISHIANFSMGNMRAQKLRVTMGTSSNTADVPTKVGRVSWAVIQPLQGSAMPSSRINSGVAGTALSGNLAIHSGTSAGSYYVIAFGPTGLD